MSKQLNYDLLIHANNTITNQQIRKEAIKRKRIKSFLNAICDVIFVIVFILVWLRVEAW